MQIYVFAKQHDRIFHLIDKVDIIITDSPIIMGLSYCNWDIVSKSFDQLVVDEFNRPETVNVNYFINRVNKYNPSGRSQTEEEAKEKDREIKDLLNKYDVPFEYIDGNEEAIDILLKDLLKLL